MVRCLFIEQIIFAACLTFVMPSFFALAHLIISSLAASLSPPQKALSGVFAVSQDMTLLRSVVVTSPLNLRTDLIFVGNLLD